MTDSTIELQQGTDEWKAARIGSLGASVVHEVMAKTKSGPSASRAKRLAALLLERLTGRAQDFFETDAMRTGKEREPEARTLYARQMFLEDIEVTETGLWHHPTLIGTHASPDGLVGDDGLLEIKCPQPVEHLRTLLEQSVAVQYIDQIQWQLRCTDRQWCDYLSYNPDFPDNMRYWIKRIFRDDKRIAEIEQEVAAFILELEHKVGALTKLYGQQEAA